MRPRLLIAVTLLGLVAAPEAMGAKGPVARDLELFDFDASFTEMERAGGVRRLRGVAVAVLSHGRPFDLPPGFAQGFPERLERLWRRTQEGLARLAPGGRDVRARRSSHYIQLDQPRLVSRAVRRVVRQVRAGAR